MFPKSFQKLIDHFSSLPSVGPKLAERLVLYLWKQDKAKIEAFAESLKDIKTKVGFCEACFNIAENGLCAVCADKSRDKSTLCVVEEPLDIISMEKTKLMRGLYHVLGGTLSASPKSKDLKIKELLARAKKPEIVEIIIATNPTSIGEATALYIARLLKPSNKKVTRLARGLPTGGDIEYADEATLSGAIEGRKRI